MLDKERVASFPRKQESRKGNSKLTDKILDARTGGPDEKEPLQI